MSKKDRELGEVKVPEVASEDAAGKVVPIEVQELSQELQENGLEEREEISALLPVSEKLERKSEHPKLVELGDSLQRVHDETPGTGSLVDEGTRHDDEWISLHVGFELLEGTVFFQIQSILNLHIIISNVENRRKSN